MLTTTLSFLICIGFLEIFKAVIDMEDFKLHIGISIICIILIIAIGLFYY